MVVSAAEYVLGVLQPATERLRWRRKVSLALAVGLPTALALGLLLTHLWARRRR